MLDPLNLKQLYNHKKKWGQFKEWERKLKLRKETKLHKNINKNINKNIDKSINCKIYKPMFSENITKRDEPTDMIDLTDSAGWVIMIDRGKKRVYAEVLQIVYDKNFWNRFHYSGYQTSYKQCSKREIIGMMVRLHQNFHTFTMIYNLQWQMNKIVLQQLLIHPRHFVQTLNTSIVLMISLLEVALILIFFLMYTIEKL